MIDEKRILEEISQFDTPTISNAMECFRDCDKLEDFMDYTIRPLLPVEGTVVARVATAKIGTRNKPTEEQKKLLTPYYEHVRAMGPGCVVVHEDVDGEPLGSFWGEVNACMHLALGCVGVVTSGGVRDLDAVESMPFLYFGKEVVVSRVHTHVEEVGCPVTVGGMTVYPGDILACDRHGVVRIPERRLPYMAEACRRVSSTETPVLEPCKKAIAEGRIIEVAELVEWRKEMAKMKQEIVFDEL